MTTAESRRAKGKMPPIKGGARWKFPQTITHDKMLVDCDAEVREFLNSIDQLGEKLGT
jgi:hypothetical protein